MRWRRPCRVRQHGHRPGWLRCVAPGKMVPPPGREASQPDGEIPLLYVHPRGHLNDLVVPAGALSALNAFPGPKLGRYSFEVTDAEIRGARVIAMDLHWALGLTGITSLLARVREVHPGVPTVVGGITASHHPEALLADLGVSYVIRGDSEEAFPSLITALLTGRDPGNIPNVWSPRRRPRQARISQGTFDAADPLTASWFPTLGRVRDWRTAAFPMSATLPVARGCSLRCPDCHGSHAATSGDGVLILSPPAFARHLRRARDLGLRSLRLVLGKLPTSRLSGLFAAAAEAGPFSFPEGVGLYTCSPPSRADLSALLRAFAGMATLSFVPPAAQTPLPGPAALAREEKAWHDVAAAVASEPRLQLDAWASDQGTLAATRRLIGAPAPRVGVSLSAAWSLTRPGAGPTRSLAELARVLAPAWTFYAAKLLSPALEQVLAPFRLLDELDSDPITTPDLPPPLATWQSAVRAYWGEHRLPALPGLGFLAVPVRSGPGRSPAGTFGATRLHGRLTVLGVEAAALRLDAASPLDVTHSHDAVRLHAPLRLAHGEGVAIIPGPSPSDTGASDLPGVDRFLVISTPAVPPASSIQIALRVQEAEVAILDADGKPISRGRSELGYFQPG